jgi:RNA polymerase sigma-70 factor (ECF subfamily)
MNSEDLRFKDKIVSLRQKLFLTAFSYLQSREDADDAVQETLLKLWQNRREIDSVTNPAGYAMQTLKNACIDSLRRRRETESIDENTTFATSTTPLSELTVKDDAALIGLIIERLPQLQQTVIRLRDIEGWEIEEIADFTSTAASAVTMNLSRARKRVKEVFLKITKERNEYRASKY